MTIQNRLFQSRIRGLNTNKKEETPQEEVENVIETQEETQETEETVDEEDC